MRSGTILVLGISLIISGCASFRGAGDTQAPARTILLAGQMSENPAADLGLDLSSLSFLEKNHLYLQLLEDRQADGDDTRKAEEIYLKSLESSLAGSSAEADRYLHEAVLLLWK